MQIQPRLTNISIDYKHFHQPVLRLHCSVLLSKANAASISLGEPAHGIASPPKQPTSKGSRPSTASTIASSSIRSFSSQSTDSAPRSNNRNFKTVSLLVSGEGLWLSRPVKDGQRDMDTDFIKSYDLPAILSTVVGSLVEDRTLKLGFLTGDLLLIKAINEEDWLDLFNCLGPVSCIKIAVPHRCN